MKSNNYPRVLVIALGRINKCDNYNNGLLLRNLFGNEWPRDRLAQIYSSGDTGDSGFFGKYYKLQATDRRFGQLFYFLKSNSSSNQNIGPNTEKAIESCQRLNLISWSKQQAVRLLIDTGLYELIFRPRLSKELLKFVAEFKPDVIFAQGYNLTFCWLPLLLKNLNGTKLAVLTTDDWPKYLYAGMQGEPKYLQFLMRPAVERTAFDFFKSADIPFAFGEPMANEYTNRYRKKFLSINHTDSPKRFENCTKHATYNANEKTIIAIGTFNHFRWPLLLDADAACEVLSRNGCPVRILVLSSSVEEEGRRALENAKFVDILPDPGNDELPGYLKAADALLLIESFDETFVSAIELSVSSKAHLFMFSQKPIIVYAAEKTGIAKYAVSHGWAEFVGVRSSAQLAASIRKVFENKAVADELVKKANSVAHQKHTSEKNQQRFLKALSQPSAKEDSIA